VAKNKPNGLTLEKLKIDERLRSVEGKVVEIETKSEERHDTQIQNIGEIKTSIQLLCTYTKNQPTMCFDRMSKYVAKVIGFTIGIPISVGVIITLVIKIAKAFNGK